MPRIFLKKYPQSAERPLRPSAPAFAFLIFFVAVAAYGCAVKSKEDFRPWNTFLFDSSRVNYNEDKIELPLKSAWSKDVSPFKLYNKFPKQQLSSPAVSGGVFYAGSTNEKFYALGAETGNALWRYRAGFPLEGPPAVTEAFVCFGAGDGAFRCLDKKTGKESWRYQTRSEAVSSPLIEGGRVYLYSADDKLHALDLNTGEKLWVYSRGVYQTISPRLFSAPAAAAGGRRIYQLFSDGNLVCISSDTGKPVWTKKIVRSFDTDEKIRRTPVVFDGSVYIIDDTNTILALSEETGELKNIYNIIKANDFVITGKRHIAIAGANRVVALDMTTGAILWNTELKRGTLNSLMAAGDYLFALSNYEHVPLGIKFLSSQKGYVEALSLKTGQPVWGTRLSSTVSANASYSERRFAVISDDGNIRVLKPR